MSVSDERIEAAWHAIRMDKENWNCGVDPCDKEDDGYESCACWRHARAALEADAPALESARAEGRERCALMADVHGWKGRADERTSDYEQGARDMADLLSAHFRSAIDARLPTLTKEAT